MDFHRNVSFSGGLPAPQPLHDTLKPEYPPVSVQTSTVPGGCSGSLDEFLFTDKTDGDIGLEWLSVFVEDCFSFTGNCLPGENQATATQLQKTVSTEPTSTKPAGNLQKPNLELVVPGKARTKRRRSSSTWSYDHEEPLHENSFDIDPPLLQQAYWLADSELLIQKPKEDQKTELLDEEEEQQEEEGEDGEEEKTGKDGNNSGGSDGSNGQPRRCSHCLAQKTPQWRAGPLGPKTLCNACGVRFKSGRLLPEYRPAKSPTFVSFKHSNSHKKVMEMRMSTIVSE